MICGKEKCRPGRIKGNIYGVVTAVVRSDQEPESPTGSQLASLLSPFIFWLIGRPLFRTPFLRKFSERPCRLAEFRFIEVVVKLNYRVISE